MLKPISKIKEEFLMRPNGDFCQNNGIFSLEKVADEMCYIIAVEREKINSIIMDKKSEYTQKSSSGNTVKTLLSKKDKFRNELCDEILEETKVN